MNRGKLEIAHAVFVFIYFSFHSFVVFIFWMKMPVNESTKEEGCWCACVSTLFVRNGRGCRPMMAGLINGNSTGHQPPHGASSVSLFLTFTHTHTHATRNGNKKIGMKPSLPPRSPRSSGVNQRWPPWLCGRHPLKKVLIARCQRGSQDQCGIFFFNSKENPARHSDITQTFCIPTSPPFPSTYTERETIRGDSEYIPKSYPALGWNGKLRGMELSGSCLAGRRTSSTSSIIWFIKGKRLKRQANYGTVNKKLLNEFAELPNISNFTLPLEIKKTQVMH